MVRAFFREGKHLEIRKKLIFYKISTKKPNFQPKNEKISLILMSPKKNAKLPSITRVNELIATRESQNEFKTAEKSRLINRKKKNNQTIKNHNI
jgi:hypothetical protein